MRQIILVVLFALAASSAWAGNNMEFQAKKVGNPGVWKYTTTVSFGEDISPTFGWKGFVLASNTWSEAYFGPTFKPTTWLTFALCAGIQNSPQVSRFAGWYKMTHGNLSLFHVVEDGDGRWHKLLLSYDLEPIKIQFWDQDGLGRGPRVQVLVPQGTSIYVGLMFDQNQTNTSVGLIKEF